MKNLLILFLLVSTSMFAQTNRLPIKPIGSVVVGKRLLLGKASGTPASNVRRFTVGGVLYTDGRYTFSLDTSSRVSINIIRLPDSTLVRELVKAVRYPAGTSTVYWDGLDNNAQPIPGGSYIFVGKKNNVRYTWEGVAGNSSFVLGNTANSHRGYQFIRKAVEVGNYVYYDLHYTEGPSKIAKFAKSTPQTKIDIFPTNYGSGTGSEHICSDGTRVYFSNYDRLGAQHQNKTWVAALTASSDAPYTFTSGGSYKPNKSDYTESTAGLITADSTSNFITGLAVQKTGNALLVSYGAKNQVRVFNKLTGAQTATITSLTNPRGMCVDGSDNIWIISGTNTVARYSLSGTTLSSAALTLPSTVAPLTVAVSPDGATVTVADGGSSQQVKGYVASSGSLSWTQGQAGGYSTTSTVSNDRFYFSDLSGGINEAGIVYMSDGSYWLTDLGNYRLLHFDQNRTYLEQISYISASYTSAVDMNNPTRVFDQYLEYAVDYTKPLSTGVTLVRNWRNQAPASLFKLDNPRQNVDMFAVFSNLLTLSNNRTYAFCKRYTDNAQVLFELVTGGQLRATGISFPPPVNLLPDGSLAYTSKPSGTVIQWNRRNLTGFDSNNNPQWGSAYVEATTPVNPLTDPVDPSGYGDTRAGLRTASNHILTYSDILTVKISEGIAGLGAHLGAIKVNGTSWLAKTQRGTSGPAYRGEYPDDGAEDVGNHADFKTGKQIGFGGGGVSTVANHVFTNYFGEFWKDSQTNKWHHRDDNLMLLGTWGPTGRDNPGSRDIPGMAGGVHFGCPVFINGVVYIWHAEEGGFSGLHRIRVDNLNSIAPLTVMPVTHVATRSFLAAPSQGTDLLAGLNRSDTMKVGYAGWSFTGTPDYSAEFGGKFWSLRTSVRSYDLFRSPDLWIQFRKDSVTYTASRTLPVNASLASWSVGGILNLVDGWSNDGQISDAVSGGWYADVVDNAGKVILRFYMQRDGSVSPSRVRLFVNNTALVVTNEFGGDLAKLATNQPLSISRTASGMQFSYAGYSASNLTTFESGADNTRPALIKFTFWNKSASVSRDRYVNIQKLTFQTP